MTLFNQVSLTEDQRLLDNIAEGLGCEAPLLHSELRAQKAAVAAERKAVKQAAYEAELNAELPLQDIVKGGLWFAVASMVLTFAGVAGGAAAMGMSLLAGLSIVGGAVMLRNHRITVARRKSAGILEFALDECGLHTKTGSRLLRGDW